MVKSTTVTTYGSLYENPQKKGSASKVSKSYGLGFPTGKKLQGGYFHKESGIELVRNNLRQLLLTDKGERAMSNFGVSLKKFLFEPLDKITMEGITEEVLTQVAKYNPNLKILKLTVRPLDKYGVEGYPGITITLTCKVKDTANSVFDVNVGLV